MATAIEATKKEEFVIKTGARTIPAPRGRKMKNLSEETANCFKLGVFGPTGSGKTFLIVALLLHGLKVGVISTDAGGDGLITVKTELKKIGRPELIKNLVFDNLENPEEIKNFLKNPLSVYPDFYDNDFDFLIWDGFSSFQMNILPEMIGDLAQDKASLGDKELAEAREEGLQFEINDWGVFRNYTVRSLDRFLKINNKKTGKVWHKVVTFLEGIKGVQVKGSNGMDTTIYKETREPWLQGSAVKAIGPMFDLIMNTRAELDDKTKKRKFKYICAGHDQPAGAKTRGLDVEPEMDADMFKLWPKICEQLDIKLGNKVVEGDV